MSPTTSQECPVCKQLREATMEALLQCTSMERALDGYKRKWIDNKVTSEDTADLHRLETEFEFDRNLFESANLEQAEHAKKCDWAPAALGQ